MWIADLPNLPPASTPVVMMADARPQQVKNILGVCKVANGKTDINPAFNAQTYMYEFYGKDMFAHGATAKIIQQPKHGSLAPTEGAKIDNYFYEYTPNQLPPGTKDYFVISVENKGITVNIRYYIYIDIPGPNEPADLSHCGEKQFWKISRDSNGNSILTAVNPQSPFINAGTTTDTAARASILREWEIINIPF